MNHQLNFSGQVLNPKILYSGKNPKIPVNSGTKPTSAHMVFGPTATRYSNAIPTTTLITRSSVLSFFISDFLRASILSGIISRCIVKVQ